MIFFKHISKGMLPGLILAPGILWGQAEPDEPWVKIITPPVNTTVCYGESATFESVVRGGYVGWLVNGNSEPPEWLSWHIDVDVKEPNKFMELVFPASTPIEYNGAKILSMVKSTDSPVVYSVPAYLFYKFNLKDSVAGLTARLTPTGRIQVKWTACDSCHYYQLGIKDLSSDASSADANYLPNQTDPHFTFLPESDDHCYFYQLQVAAVQMPYPECDEIRSVSLSSVVIKEPELSPVSARFADNQLRVDWTLSDSPVRITITDLKSGQKVHTVDYSDAPPYFYRVKPEAGTHSADTGNTREPDNTPLSNHSYPVTAFNRNSGNDAVVIQENSDAKTYREITMNIQVAPVRCNSPAFADAVNIRFQVEDQPVATEPVATTGAATEETITTAPATEINIVTTFVANEEFSEHSYSLQNSFQPVLLAVAVVISLLKW